MTRLDSRSRRSCRSAVAARSLSPRASAALALAVFVGISFLYFGLRVVVGRENQYIGFSNDPMIFIWSLAWWPHALSLGQNPFVTHLVWAPGATNLAWVTSVPGFALVLAPLTLLFDPIAAYNVLAVALPAFAAWTMFLLCRRLTGGFWPSLVGGYLFGFSSYMLGQTEGGHPNLTAVAGIPLAALLVLRWVQGELRSLWLGLGVGGVFGFELLVSTEVALHDDRRAAPRPRAGSRARADAPCAPRARSGSRWPERRSSARSSRRR